MKKLITILTMALMLFAGTAFAGTACLEWTPLPDQNNGVRIYIGTETGTYQWSHDAGVGISQTTVPNLLPETKYYFAAKTYTPQGVYSNDYSNEVFTTIPSENILPELPEIQVGNVTITIRVVE